jgi:hypothetical protein
VLPHTSRTIAEKRRNHAGKPVGTEPLQRLGNARVQLSPLRLKKGSVRHLVGERVGEGVFEVGKELRLVDEPGGLESGETAPNIGFGRVGDLMRQHDWDVGPDDRRGLEQALLVAPSSTSRRWPARAVPGRCSSSG